MGPILLTIPSNRYHTENLVANGLLEKLRVTGRANEVYGLDS